MARPLTGKEPGALPNVGLRVARISNMAFWWMALLLLAATAFSTFLVSKHFGGGLPGCGPKSGCQELEASVWGKVPGIGWPVSFLGLAYFVALLAGWIVSRRAVPLVAGWLLRAGAVASLVFIGVMIALRKFCPYCAGVHGANIVFVVLFELQTRLAARPAPAGNTREAGRSVRAMAGAAVGAFVAASLVLGLADVRFQTQMRARAESDRRASTDQILAQSREADSGRSTDAGRTATGAEATKSDQNTEAGAPTVPDDRASEGKAADGSRSGSNSRGGAGEATGVGTPADGAKRPGDQARPPDANRAANPARPEDAGRYAGTKGQVGFTGRYRLGPAASPIRVVMLTDYQCPDCKRIEEEMDQILSSRKDVSLSIKHFPMCAEAAPGVPCNRYARQTLHGNACWAARAAEAAGILKGEEGFWAMHRWLFSRKGTFTDAELKAGAAQLGFDPQTFVVTMMAPQTLERVQADCEEGAVLGLYFTPMIFVNGVEFKGWQIPNALRKTIEEVAATNPPALTAAADHPVLAGQKDIDDWMAQPVRAMPADLKAWSLGATPPAAGAARSKFADVVLFGDYQEPFTASMDRAIRDLIKGRPALRYTFRHYPIDPSSNPALPEQVRKEAIHPLAGKAARAAEAAGQMGGSAGYWKMHAWLMENVASFNDDNLRAAAAKMGLDPDRLFVEMAKPEVAAAIEEDARAGKLLGLTGVPMVFVNGRWVQRTVRDKDNVVLRVIDRASRP